MSEFDKGVSMESYYISIAADGSCFLFRYEITDPSKFIFWHALIHLYIWEKTQN